MRDFKAVWGLIMYEIHMGLPEMKRFWNAFQRKLRDLPSDFCEILDNSRFLRYNAHEGF